MIKRDLLKKRRRNKKKTLRQIRKENHQHLKAEKHTFIKKDETVIKETKKSAQDHKLFDTLKTKTKQYENVAMNKITAIKGEHQKIAVWATNLTLKEKKFARLMERFEDEHTIYKIPCPKLVELVETEKLQNTDLVYAALHEYLHQTQGEEIDSIVLGCTHFVFYKERLQDMLPSSIQLIDGNYGTAHHLKDILTHKNLLNDSTGTIEWHNTDADKINLSKRLLKQLEGTL